MDYTFFTRFAVTYNCNAYGSSTYNNTDACTTTTGTTTGTSGGNVATGNSLANTGTNIAIGISAGVLLIVLGAVILLKLRKKQRA